jgi:hypothetical protein
MKRTPSTMEETLYFCAITALTIGYGDVVPTSTFGRIDAILLGLIGMVFAGLIVAAAVRGVQEAARRAAGRCRASQQALTTVRSELLVDLPDAWEETAESTAIVARRGNIRRQAFVPRMRGLRPIADCKFKPSFRAGRSDTNRMTALAHQPSWPTERPLYFGSCLRSCAGSKGGSGCAP